MKLSEKERVILAVLGEDTMHGIDIVNNSGGLLRRGTVYVHLNSMEDRGLIESLPGDFVPGSSLRRLKYRARKVAT